VARGSASVEAWDSASVEARGSASVVARGSASVEAWGSASVEAGSYVAVHLHSQAVTLSGGVVIDMTALDPYDPTTWLGYHGLTPDADGHVVLYKAVDDALRSGHCSPEADEPPRYEPGATVEAPDWRADHTCGGGLHFGPTPAHAAASSTGTVTRYLAVHVHAADLHPIGWEKAKTPSCTVLREVDRHGKPVAS
jgi:hypothetical protein